MNCQGQNANTSLIRDLEKPSFLQVCTSSSRRFPRSSKNATRNGPNGTDAIPSRAWAGKAKSEPESARQQTPSEGARTGHLRYQLRAKGADWRSKKRACLSNPEQRTACILKWAHREPGGACLKGINPMLQWYPGNKTSSVWLCGFKMLKLNAKSEKCCLILCQKLWYNHDLICLIPATWDLRKMTISTHMSMICLNSWERYSQCSEKVIFKFSRLW